MQSYYNALSEAYHCDTHDMFVEPTVTVVDGPYMVAHGCHVERPTSPRLKLSIERELNRVSAWLKSH
ncbi:MAG TPA: hypothetical protein VKP88_07925 [Candidatus Paceibacterota bacterium]|nr:hypothetical protein [Candidatus Paceibacterota bacterium]